MFFFFILYLDQRLYECHRQTPLATAAPFFTKQIAAPISYATFNSQINKNIYLLMKIYIHGLNSKRNDRGLNVCELAISTMVNEKVEMNALYLKYKSNNLYPRFN